MPKPTRRCLWWRGLGAAALAFTLAAGGLTGAQAQTQKPNILIIWGDDIGVHNISAYNHGIMGYRTPNIDRIAREGALFTDAYGEQSCTAGRGRSTFPSARGVS